MGRHVGLVLTPEVLAAAYNYLRVTPPFNRWKMPLAHNVRFRVTSSPTDAGYCDRGTIGVSRRCIGYTAYLVEIMAHEMIHLHLDRKNVKKHHVPEFQACAARVCAIHGFDPKRFF